MAKILAAMLLLPTLAMAEEVGGKDIIVSSVGAKNIKVSSVSLPANKVGLCAAARPKRTYIHVSVVPANSDVRIGDSSLTPTGGYLVPVVNQVGHRDKSELSGCTVLRVERPNHVSSPRAVMTLRRLAYGPAHEAPQEVLNERRMQY
jgi:hypothetical protein